MGKVELQAAGRPAANRLANAAGASTFGWRFKSLLRGLPYEPRPALPKLTNREKIMLRAMITPNTIMIFSDVERLLFIFFFAISYKSP